MTTHKDTGMVLGQLDRITILETVHGHPFTMIPLPGLPHEPELFRPVEEPLGLAPFPLSQVALGCMWSSLQRGSVG